MVKIIFESLMEAWKIFLGSIFQNISNPHIKESGAELRNSIIFYWVG